MKADSDVLVVGGGAVGICTAYYLAQQGIKVTVVEQGEVASGCSEANAGLIVPSYCVPLANPAAVTFGLKGMLKPGSPFYFKPRFDRALFRWLLQFEKACKWQKMRQGIQALHELNYASLELFDQIIRSESLACGYRKDGWLKIYRTDKQFRKSIEEASLLNSYGIKSRILSVHEALEMEPVLNPEIKGGIFFPEDGHLDPVKFVVGLAECLQDIGVNIHVKTKVISFETSDGCVTAVRTSHGDYQPKKVILTAGAWSTEILKKLDKLLLIQPAKGYSISVKRPISCPRLPLYLSEVKVAITPFEDVLRFAGTLHLVGMDFSVNKRQVHSVIHAVEDCIGQLKNLDIIKISAGLRPCSPDGLPIIDYLPDYKNLIVATGHCMLGITLAPITGKLISQLVCEQSPDLSLSPFRISRFKKRLIL